MASEIVTTDQIATPEFMAAQDFEAILTDELVDQLEDCARSYGTNRRLIYALLTKSKQQLSERIDDLAESAEIYFQMFDAVKNYREHLNAQVEQAEKAELRILCMLSTINARHEAKESGGQT